MVESPSLLLGKERKKQPEEAKETSWQTGGFAAEEKERRFNQTCWSREKGPWKEALQPAAKQ